jgi:hypothetical protein
MHIERCWAAAQDVIVYGSDVDAVFDQLSHHRIDLGLEQHKIAHHHGAAMHWLERRPPAERQRGPDGDAIERHLQVGARKPVPMDIAGHGGGPSSRFVDLLPVDLLGAGSSADGRNCANR